jgi:hypothetical protein
VERRPHALPELTLGPNVSLLLGAILIA